MWGIDVLLWIRLIRYWKGVCTADGNYGSTLCPLAIQTSNKNCILRSTDSIQIFQNGSHFEKKTKFSRNELPLSVGNIFATIQQPHCFQEELCKISGKLTSFIDLLETPEGESNFTCTFHGTGQRYFLNIIDICRILRSCQYCPAVGFFYSFLACQNEGQRVWPCGWYRMRWICLLFFTYFIEINCKYKLF